MKKRKIPIALSIRSRLSDLGSAAFRKRHAEVGASPGTLVTPEDAHPPTMRIMSFNASVCDEKELERVEELTIAFEPDNVTWVDIQGFGAASFMKQVQEHFGLHPLAIEVVVNVPQRPKLEVFDDHLVIVTRMVRLVSAEQVDIEQVTVVIGENYVLTFQERPGDVLNPVRRRIRSGTGKMRNGGSSYLAYAIIDTIVDGYYPVIEALGEHLDQLEHEVVERPTKNVLRELNRTKNMLANLRRAIWPQRDAVNTMLRDEHPLISDEVRLYIRDTHDHCIQTAEVVEMYREIATGLMNIYLSSIANRTNEVMKVLTIMASIFIPLTFMVGVYGMNFDHMPELHVRWAYPALCVIMLSTATGLLIFFRKKGWLGGS